MATKLPPIQLVKECPHCGGDQFYVMQRYTGRGQYHRKLDGSEGASNGLMHDCLIVKAEKTAFCSDCNQAIGRWDQEADESAYSN
jgi:hypothetical protein